MEGQDEFRRDISPGSTSNVEKTTLTSNIRPSSHQKIQLSTNESNFFLGKYPTEDTDIINYTNSDSIPKFHTQNNDIHSVQSIELVKKLLPVRILQRQASPEIKAPFKFGMAPRLKQSSFSSKKPAAEKYILQEKSDVNSPDLMAKNFPEARFNSVKRTATSSNSVPDSAQISSQLSTSNSSHAYHKQLKESVPKAVPHQKSSGDLVVEIQYDDMPMSNHYSEWDQKKNSSIGNKAPATADFESYIFSENRHLNPKEINVRYLHEIPNNGNLNQMSAEVLQNCTHAEKENDHLPFKLSDDQSTRNHEKIAPRLPSKKPRIKRLFPEAINMSTCLQEVYGELDSSHIFGITNDGEKNCPNEISKDQSSPDLNRPKIIKKSMDRPSNSLHPSSNDTQYTAIRAEAEAPMFNTQSGQKHQNMFQGFVLSGDNNLATDKTISNYSPNAQKTSEKKESCYLNKLQSSSPKQNSDKIFNYSSTAIYCNVSEANLNKQALTKIKSFCENSVDCHESGGNFQDFGTESENLNTEIDQNSQLISPSLSRVLSEPSKPSSQCGGQMQLENTPARLNNDPGGTSGAGISNEISKRGRKLQDTKIHFDAIKADQTLNSVSTGWDYKKLIESHSMFVDLVKDCEGKSEIIEKQKTQILELERKKCHSTEKIRRMENDVKILTVKSEKFNNIWKKYKDHINDIIISQKDMNEQRKEVDMRLKPIEALPKTLGSEIAELKDEIQAATEKIANINQNIQKVSKDVQETNKKLVKHNLELREQKNASHIRSQDLEKKNRETENLAIQREAEKNLLNLTMENLKVHIEELETSKTNLTEQVRRLDVAEQEALFEKRSLEEQLKNAIEIAQGRNQIIENLHRERNESEKLIKELESFRAYHVEQIGLIKKTPTVVACEIFKENSLLSKIFSAGDVTREKIEEAFNDHKAKSVELQDSLLRLIEGHFSRLEISIEKQDNSKVICGKIDQTVEYLKKSLLDLQRDNQSNAHLSASISTLQKTNENLIKEKVNLEDETRLKAIELNELKSKLHEYENNLRAKTIELDLALAVPKEDPQVKAQVEILKNENVELKHQLGAVIQEFSNLEKSREEANVRERNMNEIEKILSDAKLRIQGFEDEKKNYIIQKDQENKNLCQELTKKSESSKATLKLKLETEVKNLEQKIKGKVIDLLSKDEELSTVRDELKEANENTQKLKEENKLQHNVNQRLEEELASCKEKLSLLTPQIKLMESRPLDIDITKFLETSICGARQEISKLQAFFKTIKEENAHLGEMIIADKQEIFKLRTLYTQTQAQEQYTFNMCNKPTRDGLEDSKDFLFLESGVNQKQIKANTPTKEFCSAILGRSSAYISCDNIDTKIEEKCTENGSTPQNFTDSFQNFINGQPEIRETIFPSSDKKKESKLFVGDCHESVENEYFQSSERKINLNFVTDKSDPQNDSNSSSLTDVELMIHNLPSVLCRDRPNLEYEETKNLQKTDSQCSKLVSASNTGSYRTAKHGTEQAVNPTGSIKVTDISHSQARDTDNDESSTKKRGRKTNKLLTGVKQPKRKCSGLSRPTLSSSRTQIAQGCNLHPSAECQCSELNCEVLPSHRSGSLEIQRAEPAESNVKHRRKEMSPDAFSEVPDRREAKTNGVSGHSGLI